MSASQATVAPILEPPPNAASKSRATSTADVLRIAPLLLLAYSFLLFPPEMRVNIGDLALPLYRLVIMAFAYPLVARALRGEIRIGWPDLLVLGASAWMTLSFLTVYPFGEALIRSGGLVLDFAGAYFLARLSIRSSDDFRRWLVLVVPGLFFAGALVFLESITRQVFWRPMFIDIFGALPQFVSGEEIGTLEMQNELRLGLARGYGPFSHQILAGAVLVSILPLYFNSGLRSWPRWVGIPAALFGIFSLSSAAILGLLLAIAMLLTDWAKRAAGRIHWAGIAALGSIMLLGLHLATQNGLVHLLTRLTLNPQTAYYRQIIWRYGWQSMIEHPLFGIGFHEHERPSWVSPSVDAHFLAIAIRNGIPAPAMLLAALLAVIFVLGKKAARSKGHEREFLIGVNFSLVTLLVLSMTVMFYAEANIWFMLIFGAGASLASIRPGRSI